MMREEWEKSPLNDIRALLRTIIYNSTDEFAAKMAREALDKTYLLEKK